MYAQHGAAATFASSTTTLLWGACAALALTTLALGVWVAVLVARLRQASRAAASGELQQLRKRLADQEELHLRQQVRQEADRDSHQQARQRQGDFLAAMSHELRTPLAGIVGLSRMLAANGQAGQFTQDMGSIERLAQQLLRTVDEGLAFVRNEPAPARAPGQTTRMDHLLRDIQVLATWLAQQHNNRFSLVTYTTIPDRLALDEQKLRQVLINLITNASRYCSDGYISVTVALEDDHRHRPVLVWTVLDSGRGMSKEEQRRFLQPFSKSSDSTGLGLGLALVRRLVGQMGGHLSVWSEKGQGTQMRVHVPVQLDRAGAPAPTTQPGHLLPVDSVVVASSPLSNPRDSAPRLDPTVLKEVRGYVKHGQVSRIEDWIREQRALSRPDAPCRRFLDHMAVALANVDLLRLNELLDEADIPRAT